MAKIGYIQIIRKCNQQCIICSNPSNEKRMSVWEANREVERLAKSGYESVIFTGGEPTLHPDLSKMIEFAIKKKIFPRIITNGQLIADRKYLKSLSEAGLRHIHLSIYSHRDSIQTKLSRNKLSLKNIKKAFDNLKKEGNISVDVNIAISSYNSNHLSELVRWIVDKYPFVKNFVFNNLDPFMNRVSENPEVVPKLNDFEFELHEALKILEKHKKTFRVERVPLCYLAEFEHVSTETRKIVKKEDRPVFFLDQRGRRNQKKWSYEKSKFCRKCFIDEICAGLYTRGGHYNIDELHPVFINQKEIKQKIK